MTGPDALTQALLRQHPELAGRVHYVDGHPWCDGVNHTTRCPGASTQPPCIAPEHYSRRESDGVLVCQICGDVKPAAGDDTQSRTRDNPRAAGAASPRGAQPLPPQAVTP